MYIIIFNCSIIRNHNILERKEVSKTVYSNLLSSAEILYITSLAENHADFAAYFHSKMIILMVRELSQTFPLCTFHMLKCMPILLNPTIIPAVSFPNQVFPKLNIPLSSSWVRISRLLPTWIPSPQNSNELMIRAQFIICGMTRI